MINFTLTFALYLVYIKIEKLLKINNYVYLEIFNNDKSSNLSPVASPDRLD